MGFFKEFKEDFSDAVNELVPGGDSKELEDDAVVNTIDEDIDVASELSKLDGLLEQVAKKVDNNESVAMAPQPKTAARPKAAQPQPQREASAIREEESKMEAPTRAVPAREQEEMSAMSASPTAPSAPVASDENAIITAGMRITGNLESSGSIEVQGGIEGNVSCNGKLIVTGTIRGNSASAEFFADSAKIEGEVSTSGTVKIGVGSVIIGNISATSAVIAGAVKGDIDVQGPVVVDTSAVIMGNIKSRSVQINNGAVIEGFCSQSYAEVDVEGLFA